MSHTNSPSHLQDTGRAVISGIRKGFPAGLVAVFKWGEISIHPHDKVRVLSSPSGWPMVVSEALAIFGQWLRASPCPSGEGSAIVQATCSNHAVPSTRRTGGRAGKV